MKKVERFHETGGLHERGGEEGNSMELQNYGVIFIIYNNEI